MSDASDKIDPSWLLLFACWLVATGATLGSFFFSEVMDLPPCSLCWYQRVFMFPLPIVMVMGLFPFDPRVVRYALPLAIGGWLVAGYHMLLHVGIVPETMSPCSRGVSCKTDYLNLFGVVSIPLLSLLAFSIVVALLIVLMRRLSR